MRVREEHRMQRGFFVVAICLAVLSMWVGNGFEMGTTSAHAQAASPPRIQGLTFDASDVLSSDELDAVTDEFVGTELTMEQLQRLIDTLNQLYAAKGYLAQALVSPQTVDAGVIHVTLIEGRVGSIRIAESRWTRPSYFTNRLSLAAGDLLHIDRLDDDVTYLNRTSDVAIRVELVPGEAYGASDVVVYAQEPTNSRFTLAVDGSGRPDTGQFRTSIAWRTPSLLRSRDPLSISLVYAHGTQAQSLSYSHPISPKGSRLGISYNKNEVKFLDGVYAPVGLRVATESSNVTYSVPLHVSPDTIAILSVERHANESNTYLSGERLTGSESKGLLVALSIESVTPHGTWTFNEAVRGGRAQTPNDSDVAYLKYTASLQHVRPVGDSGRLLLRGALQRSIEPLLPSHEQFHLGGADTVRGFDQGVASGDHGYAATVEYHWPWYPGMMGYIFADNGAVYPHKGNDEPQTSEEYLTGIGLGVNWQMGKDTLLHVSYGQPLGREEDRKSVV